MRTSTTAVICWRDWGWRPVQPMVIVCTVKMHPRVALRAARVASHVMGVEGMLIGVPLFGIAKGTARTTCEAVKRYRTNFPTNRLC